MTVETNLVEHDFENEQSTERLPVRGSTKMTLEDLGKKGESFDDLLRRLLSDNPLFVKTLKSIYAIMREDKERKEGESSGQQ